MSKNRVESKTVYRPKGRPPVGGVTKTPISFRVHPGVLERLSSIADERGMPYQTLMHDLLANEVANIWHYKQAEENGKAAALSHQLTQILNKFRADCPNFEEHAAKLEDLLNGLKMDMFGTVDLEDEDDEDEDEAEAEAASATRKQKAS
ncbi:MAG: hypothetical protein WC314_24520 [Vulcanimicrobiota bacterium]